VNETTLSDATMISTNTASQDEQFNVTDMPSGNFSIKAVVVAARATSTATATATKVALGFNSGGTVAVGTSQTTSTAWTRLTQVFAQNPVTSANWLLSEMNALQVNLRSGS
jgi:2-keto-4-pentenoate hydratase